MASGSQAHEHEHRRQSCRQHRRTAGWARRPPASNSVSDPDVAERLRKFDAEIAIPAESFARAVAFAISQPEDVDVNEILFRPTRQEL
jgi:NADP-dependent 3-hydroxy acid dehydrogenase YdfG